MKPLLLRFVLMVAVLAAGFGAGAGRAETVAGVVNPRPSGGWVSDGARVLDAATERRLNALLTQLERQTTAEMAVVTVRRAGGAASPKQFATRLFNRWGVGKRGKNNGVLVLVVLDARRIEVETGTGMARVLPDSRVRTVLEQRVVPRFREDDYAGGVLAGVQTLARDVVSSSGRQRPRVANAPARRVTPPLQTRPATTPAQDDSYPFAAAPDDSPGSRVPVAVLGGGALALLPLGAWAVARARTRHCAQCGQTMRRLGEIEDDVALAWDQRFEEDLGSVDWRVWRCDRCQATRVERAPKWLSGYSDCPLCRHRTVQSHTDVLRHPTYDWSGEAIDTRVCRFPRCPFRDAQRRVLPRRVRSATTSSGGRSSSSGGSFGGGRSSGGGAGASW